MIGTVTRNDVTQSFMMIGRIDVRDNRGYVSGLMLLLVMRKGLMGEAEFTLTKPNVCV